MDKYFEHIGLIDRHAGHMKDNVFYPMLDDVTGNLIKDTKVVAQRLEARTSGSIFESAGKSAGTLQRATADAVAGYCQRYGRVPSDEMFASAYMAMSNALDVTDRAKKRGTVNGMVLEAADMSTTEGVQMRDRMIALVMPVMLSMITTNMVSSIPGTFNQSEIFKIWRVAASTFGDMTAGDKIDQNYRGQYSSMDQIHLAATGNGAITGSSDEFEFDSATEFSAAMPFKKKSIKIMHDRDIVGGDDGAGNLVGTFVVDVTTINVTGAVNYATGNINPVFSTAPANAIDVHVGFDIDIEKDPSLIPLISTEMDSKVIYPHEAAIAADVTLQSLWTIRREYNLNADGMMMAALRNILAADKDRRILNALYFYAKTETSWNKTVPAAQYFQEYYEEMKQVLLNINTLLLSQTGVSGLSGLVANSANAALFKSMKAPNFVPAPGYKQLAQPHYCGKIFGMWDLYEDPQSPETTRTFCFAKGRGVGESGYVAGDAIPALSFKHAMGRDLTYKNTLWELSYRDLNPFDGRDFFTWLTFTTS
jgi:hypothetical protein